MFVSRVKHVPADICLMVHGHELGDDRRAALKTLQAPYIRHIVSVPSIETLTLLLCRITHRSGAVVYGGALLENMDIFPDIEVEHLSIDCMRTYTEPVNPFIARSLPMRKLSLWSVYFGLKLDSTLYLALKKLVEVKFRQVEQFPLLAFLRMAPTIQRLKLESCSITDAPNHGRHALELPSLRSLYIAHTNFPWDSILCPYLTQVHLSFSKDTIDCWQFLQRTPSITDIYELHMHDPRNYIRLANSASRITSLDARAPQELLSLLANSQEFGLSEPAFPKLTRLIVWFDNGDFPLSVLETFVRARCLPSDHPQSTMDNRITDPLKAFTIAIQPYYVKGQWKVFLDAYFNRTTHQSYPNTRYHFKVMADVLAWRT